MTGGRFLKTIIYALFMFASLSENDRRGLAWFLLYREKEGFSSDF
jgi:hypothetical protein